MLPVYDSGYGADGPSNESSQAGWGSGYGGSASHRQESGGYLDYRSSNGAPSGRQERQYRPY